MRLVPIIKTWRGHEFAVASLESVYSKATKVIYCHSDRDWSGRRGVNTVEPVIQAWKAKHDAEDKIVNIMSNEYRQENQYLAAWQEANRHPHDYKMLIDTDEVWDADQLEAAIKELKPQYPAFFVPMVSHVKSPFYQTDDRLAPVVFVAADRRYRGVRCMREKKKRIEGVHFHHFCSVRINLASVLEKHGNSCGVEGVPVCDMATWVKEKWNRLPEATDVLPIPGYEKNWPAFKQIEMKDLPESMRRNAIAQAWEKYHAITKKEES